MQQVKSNLYRHENGKYYIRTKVKGRPVWKSLKTKVRSVADALFSHELAKIKASNGAELGPDITLGECAATFITNKRERGFRRRNRQGHEQAQSRMLKPRSLKYIEDNITYLKKQWPSFDETLASSVTTQLCHEVADKVRRQYGATRFNGIIQAMRGILAVAVGGGALQSNPAMNVFFAEVKTEPKQIPTCEQVAEVFKLLDDHPQRKFARLSVRAMAFTGLRPNEARNLDPADIDLKAGTLTVRETKNGKPRTIHLIAQAVELFKTEGVPKVLAAIKKDPRRAIRTCGKKVGIHMTPYTMRHLHMTALMEAGLDLRTAAEIAGHQDSGATLWKHYLHARPDHVKKQLSKVVI